MRVVNEETPVQTGTETVAVREAGQDQQREDNPPDPSDADQWMMLEEEGYGHGV